MKNQRMFGFNAGCLDIEDNGRQAHGVFQIFFQGDISYINIIFEIRKNYSANGIYIISSHFFRVIRSSREISPWKNP
jgi:hypothetical protein